MTSVIIRGSATDGNCGRATVAVIEQRVERRFVAVGDRQVHCRIMGAGPPALFVHSSPANSSFVVPEMAVVADRYTCFAFDTPGFGLSDPLPGDDLTVADLADALAATLAAIDMPPCPVFGTHTGAAIALELAVRHPARVTGLVLDGLASFTAAEADALGEGYFQKFPADPLGGHYSALWTRFRDQSTWFPWFARRPDALNESDLTAPAATDRWLTMYFDAADSYAPPYRAAIGYADAPSRFADLGLPAILTAVDSDMLYPHLDRLPLTHARHEVRRVGRSMADRRALTGEGFDRFGSVGGAPHLAAAPVASTRVVRQFLGRAGAQLLVRTAGDPANPAAIVVHDLPGSSEDVEPLLRDLATRHFAVAFDLPGCGHSEPLGAPDLPRYSAALAAGCVALDMAAPAVWGVGWGGAIAVDLAAALGARALVLEGLPLPDADERAELLANIAPPIGIEPDGAHWFRTWQMLRDGEIWWPWFAPRRTNLRRLPGRLDAISLHRRTCETLRQPDGHCHALAAILGDDAAAALGAITVPLTVLADPVTPVGTAYAARLAALIAGAPIASATVIAAGL